MQETEKQSLISKIEAKKYTVEDTYIDIQFNRGLNAAIEIIRNHPTASGDVEGNNISSFCMGNDTSSVNIERVKSNAAKLSEQALTSYQSGVQGGWQDISTAPVATNILLYCPERGITNHERIESGFANSGNGSHHAWATHWQPLPLPPITTHNKKD